MRSLSVGVAVAAVCAVFAPPASADVECQYNATTKALGVVWNDDGESRRSAAAAKTLS
jgi:hypothetical protein